MRPHGGAQLRELPRHIVARGMLGQAERAGVLFVREHRLDLGGEGVAIGLDLRGVGALGGEVAGEAGEQFGSPLHSRLRAGVKLERGAPKGR